MISKYIELFNLLISKINLLTQTTHTSYINIFNENLTHFIEQKKPVVSLLLLVRISVVLGLCVLICGIAVCGAILYLNTLLKSQFGFINFLTIHIILLTDPPAFLDKR